MKINYDKLKKYLNYDIRVSFYDHAMNGSALPCKCVGTLAKINDLSIVLVGWDCELENQEDRISNMEYFTIVKSAITKIDIKDTILTMQ